MNTNTLIWNNQCFQHVEDQLYCFGTENPAGDTFQLSPALTQPILPYIPLKENKELMTNLIFTIIFLCIFAFIRLHEKNIFQNLILYLFQKKKITNSFHESFSSNLGFYIFGLGLSFASISVALTYICGENLLSSTFIFLFTILILWHISLISLISFMGWTFKNKHIAEECMMLIWSFHITIGLFSFPFTLGLLFLQDFTKQVLLEILAVEFFIFITTKIIRWIQILISNRISILYMILYLCALEIVPLLILYKITME